MNRTRPAALAMTRDEAMHENCCKEVAELHAFFEGWFLGTLPDTDEAFRRFSSVLAEEFEMVTPGGVTRSREEILASVRGAHGGSPKLVTGSREGGTPALTRICCTA